MSRHDSGNWLLFSILTAMTLGCYVWLLLLSVQFEQGTEVTSRPILLMLVLFWTAFLLYWIALWVVLKIPSSNRLLLVILVTSALYRITLVASTPILEIDIYRYMWDGIVATQGVSPYRYPPQVIVQRVESSAPAGDLANQELELLAELAQSDVAIGRILRTVHYGELPTPYPPVSQAVFALGAAVSPTGTTIETRLWILKSLLLMFDLATLGVVLFLLVQVGQHVGWGLAFGWCPLVIKEFANSGHLDSIAIFFCISAIAMTAVGMRADSPLRRWAIVGSAIGLAIGIGAKLFPLVLVPLFAITWWRLGSWRVALLGCVVLIVVSSALMAPMLFSSTGDNQVTTESLPRPPTPLDDTSSDVPSSKKYDLQVQSESITEAYEPSTQSAVLPTGGILEFLKRWEMNDLLFMVAVENLRSQLQVDPGQRPWFVFVPESVSEPLVRQWSELMAASVRIGDRWGIVSISGTPFLREIEQLESKPFLAAGLLVRVVMATILLVITVMLAWKATNASADSVDWLRACFYTLAWCWLLAPTQNPWYLCWALPLLPFVRQRTWLVLAACALMYYLRFWLEYHWPETPLLGTPYSGAYFFHFIVVWLEFGPWLLALAVGCIWNKRRIDTATT